MRNKPKKRLTPLQENRLLKATLVLIACAMLWLFFAPGTGVYSLLKLRDKTAELERQTQELEQANNDLRADIDRLKNDPEFLERIAREKYGMLKKNERLFDFSRNQPKNDNDSD